MATIDRPPTNHYFVQSGIQHSSQVPVFGDGFFFEIMAVVETTQLPKDLYAPVFNIPMSMEHVSLARHGGPGTARKSIPVVPGQSLGPYVNHIAFFGGHVEKVKLDHLWRLLLAQVLDAAGHTPELITRERRFPTGISSQSMPVPNRRSAVQILFCKFVEHQTEGGFWFSMLR